MVDLVHPTRDLPRSGGRHRRALGCLGSASVGGAMAVAWFAACAPPADYSSAADAASAPTADGAASNDTLDPAFYVDDVSGLKWHYATLPTTTEWSPATLEKACIQATHDGLDGWRKPTVIELRTLVQGCPELAVGGSCPSDDVCDAPCAYRTVPGGCFSKWPLSCQKGSIQSITPWSKGSANDLLYVTYQGPSAGVGDRLCDGTQFDCSGFAVVCVRSGADAGAAGD